MPLVSVVIPVFNSAPLIGSALRSVFSQTFTDFEVVVVDDGSEDHRELNAALSEWAGRIHCIRQANGGPARARNTGIAQARGQFIAFLDADDEWLPEKLAVQVEYFRRHPETGLLHTGVVDGLPAGGAVAGPPRHAFCDLFHTAFFINTLTVMIPRRVLEEVGGFDERREVHIEDWDLWLRIAARHPIGYIPSPLAYHRPGGLMSRQVERTYAAQALVIDKNKALCAQACAAHRAAPERCERTRRHVLHRDWGYDRLVAGDRAGAREQLARALRFCPSDVRTAVLYVSTFVSSRWRGRVRSVVAWRPGTPQKRIGGNAPVSLVHDTIYRRSRRRLIARLHDLDDVLSSAGRARKRILFDAASPISFAMFRPIYDRLRKDPRLELWFTAHGRVWSPHDIYARFGISENVVEPSTAARMKVDAYVNADFWDMTWLHRRTRRIHLFHGVAGKYNLDAPVDLAPIIAAFDCLMFANADRRARYVEAGLLPDDNVKAALVGYPKIDCLVDGSLDRARIARALGLDVSIPSVIYAPTWSPYSSLKNMGEEIVDRLSAEGLQVIVKLHDRSYDRAERGAGGVNWAERLAKYDAHPLVRVVHEADASPFLAVSDAMVSDHSSIAFEYMLLDRPVVVIDRPELIKQANVSPDKVRLLRAAADVARDPVEMTSRVIAALREPGLLSAERRHTAAQLFYRPGTATDRAVAMVYRLIDLPAPASAPESMTPESALAAVG
jgi:glycosyltransferase involved in cell wall biosynthesis